MGVVLLGEAKVHQRFVFFFLSPKQFGLLDFGALKFLANVTMHHNLASL